MTIPGVPKRLRPLLKEILETLSSPNKVLRSREKKVTISAPRLLWEVNMTLLPWGENHPQPPPHILGPYLMSIINWGRTRDSMNNRTSYTNDMIFCYSWGRGGSTETSGPPNSSTGWEAQIRLDSCLANAISSRQCDETLILAEVLPRRRPLRIMASTVGKQPSC